ncbi:hypothetical protein LEP1GSC168_2663 [Leptospira santarosai str. HAI134]|uniref:hypothetical protein n=1 Tax=Leptospira santarosai TaxID=28183 RepID=UPI0002BDAA7A|nr:hypothetical protein [Leptospira santarosai]EMO22254.1 hypothetical protein LEP1GSC168_2663 [Leptospira santarosai str. HAI134]
MESPESISSTRRAIGFWSLGFMVVLLLFFLISAPFFALSGSYGVALFIAIPFSIGILAAFARSFYKRATLGEIFTITLLPGGILILGFLLIGKEGFICLLMAIPLAYVPLLIGACIGYNIQNRIWSKYLVVLIVLFFNISAHVFDRIDEGSQTNEVRTSIVVHSSSQNVWKKISSSFEFGEAKNFFFRNGVSYPISMKVVHKNGRRLLECEYTNGATSAFIGEFIENSVMNFKFPEPQVTMKETSFYGNVEPKHIRGRIWASFGEFRLIPVGNGEVKIEATTRYSNGLGPKFYWKLWSDYLIDEMHEHVLQRIKLEAEKTEELNQRG